MLNQAGLRFNSEGDPKPLESAQDLVKEWEKKTEEADSFFYSSHVLTTYCVLGTARDIKERERQMTGSGHTPEAEREKCYEGSGSRWRESAALS